MAAPLEDRWLPSDSQHEAAERSLLLARPVGEATGAPSYVWMVEDFQTLAHSHLEER
jgi:hypothetical protein